MKRCVLILLMVVSVLSLALTQCAPSPTPTPQVVVKQQTVVVKQTVVVPEKAKGGVQYVWSTCLIIPFFIDPQKGAARAAEELGVNYQWLAPAEVSIPKHIEFAESALSYPGIKGMTINACDAHAYDGVIKRALEQGVAVATWGGCEDERPELQLAPICFIGNMKTIGKNCATRLAKEMGEQGEVVIAIDFLEDINQEWRRVGFVEEMAKNHPNIKIVDTYKDCGDAEGSVRCAEQAVSAHPSVKGYFCTGAMGGVGPASVFPKAGRTDIKVSAADTDPAILDGVRKGTITFTYSQAPYISGYLGVYLPYLMAEKGLKPTKKVLDLPVTFVDKNNVDKYDKDILVSLLEIKKYVDEVLMK